MVTFPVMQFEPDEGNLSGAIIHLSLPKPEKEKTCASKEF
jgi:hypothetical protein